MPRKHLFWPMPARRTGSRHQRINDPCGS